MPQQQPSFVLKLPSFCNLLPFLTVLQAHSYVVRMGGKGVIKEGIEGLVSCDVLR